MYRIGFDAKRLFHNGTGLGNYSRSLVRSLKSYFPDNSYILFTPSVTYSDESFFFTQDFETVTSGMFTSKAVWRTRLILNALLEHDIDIFHGLSHELPIGIEKTKIKSVVTIHDLIYKLFPKDFPFIDKKIYDAKWKNACTNANAIIATSEATKQDIIQYFNINPHKIHVVYQTCSDIFSQQYTKKEKEETLEKCGFPRNYMLYVGAIMDRKNVIALAQAYNMIREKIDIPLVIVGKGREYYKQLLAYIEKNNLQEKILLRSDIGNDILPIIYQSAEIFLYPSKYEGFGIPVLEAFKSGTPIILSNTSSLPEVAGNAGYYVDPYKVESIAQAMLDLHENANLRNHLINEGFEREKEFTLENFAKKTLMVYDNLM